MTSIELEARAKVNLSLDVIKKRSDGYHDIKMIMQSVELHDKIYIETIDDGIEILCDCDRIPAGLGNTAYRAAKYIIDRFDIGKGVRIIIEKKIPLAAGLAGGSSDAAAVLKGMNRLFSLGITESGLLETGVRIGADVPYCISGGTVLAEGIGDILTHLEQLPQVDIVLVNPGFEVSTACVYGSLDLDSVEKTARPDTELLITAIKNKRIDILARNMKNVLESVTVKMYDVIREIKDHLIEYGAAGSMMSGSGPTVFGVFEDRKAAENAFNAMKSSGWNCCLTHTV